VRRIVRLAVVTVAFVSVPNNPAPFWYALPEIACQLVTPDQDRWRCD
jgi:hypothetical protein